MKCICDNGECGQGGLCDLCPYKAGNDIDLVEPSKWDIRYLEMCTLVASWSKDPSSQFGAVLVDDRNVVCSMGFNGFAKGFNDTEERWNDRPFKYAHVIHAEENCLLHAPANLTGYTLYVNGPPCSSCMSKIAQKGVSTVVFYEPSEDYLSRWSVADSFRVAYECKVKLKQIWRDNADSK